MPTFSSAKKTGALMAFLIFEKWFLSIFFGKDRLIVGEKDTRVAIWDERMSQKNKKISGAGSASAVFLETIGKKFWADMTIF